MYGYVNTYVCPLLVGICVPHIRTVHMHIFSTTHDICSTYIRMSAKVYMCTYIRTYKPICVLMYVYMTYPKGQLWSNGRQLFYLLLVQTTVLDDVLALCGMPVSRCNVHNLFLINNIIIFIVSYV